MFNSKPTGEEGWQKLPNAECSANILTQPGEERSLVLVIPLLGILPSSLQTWMEPCFMSVTSLSSLPDGK